MRFPLGKEKSESSRIAGRVPVREGSKKVQLKRSGFYPEEKVHAPDVKSPAESIREYEREAVRYTGMSHTPPPGVPVMPDGSTVPVVTLWDGLTPREKEIALMLGRGDANREIAKALGLSIKTVDTHRAHLLKKLACANNAKLVLFLVREKVIVP